MSGELVALSLDRFELLPSRLARIADDLDAAARELVRTDLPEAARAAGVVDELAGWVRREHGRVRSAWAQIEAIPGLHVFHQWDPGGGRTRWDLDWLTPVDRPMHSPTELEAIAAFHHVVRPLVLAVDRGDALDPGEVDEVLALLAEIDRPELAAAHLNLLGAEGYLQLQAAVVAVAGPVEEPEDVRRLEDRLAVLTGLLAAATRATGRDRLDPRVLDDLWGPAPGGPDAAQVRVEEPPSDLDEVRELLSQLDLGREAAQRLLSFAGRGGAALVVQRAGAPLALLTVGMPLAELLEDGLTGEFAESAVNAGLSLVAIAASSTLVTLGTIAVGAIVSLIFATADDGGRPRRPSRGGAAPGGPGTGTADLFMDDHGVPVPATGV